MVYSLTMNNLDTGLLTSARACQRGLGELLSQLEHIDALITISPFSGSY